MLPLKAHATFLFASLPSSSTLVWAGEKNKSHKRQRSMGIGAIYWKKQSQEKEALTANILIAKVYNRESNSYVRMFTTEPATQPKQSRALPCGRRFPFPWARQWGEVVHNNIWIPPMSPPYYCGNLTLLPGTKTAFFKKNNKQNKFGPLDNKTEIKTEK